MSATLAHRHICDECFGTWEHVDGACFLKHPRVLTCAFCMAIARDKMCQKEAWGEMARNMPIPHDHKCVVCECEWGHNDKKCAIEEHYWLECEKCMTFTFTHPCPKCGTPSAEELMNSGYNVVRCVCPSCRHYFAPPGQEVYTAKKHFCPKCGRQASKIKSTTPGSICYACSDCEYYFYAQNEDVSVTQEGVQPNCTCSRCGSHFTANENNLGMCPQCENQFRLYNGNQHQDENETDEYGDPTGIG